MSKTSLLKFSTKQQQKLQAFRLVFATTELFLSVVKVYV